MSVSDIVINVSVGLSVCLLTSHKPHSRIHQVFCLLPSVVTQSSSDGIAILCVFFGFLYDIIFYTMSSMTYCVYSSVARG